MAKGLQGKPTRERLLDIAEELFAQHGFEGVTIRQVARQADVDVALPSYYFGSKLGMFDAVLKRRADIFNKLRGARLAKVMLEADGDPPEVEAVVTSFLAPLLELIDGPDPGWRNYFRLSALINGSSSWVNSLPVEYDEVANLFIDALEKALPGVVRARLFWGYQFLAGALWLTLADTGRIDRMSDGQIDSSDRARAFAEIIAFTSAGFRQMAEAKP